MPKNNKISLYLFYAGVYGLSASIAISKFGTSFSIILLSFSWFLEWNWKEKQILFRKNKVVLILSASLFLIFVLGLFQTQNIDYALKDLKIKAPLFIIPVIFSLTKTKLDRKVILSALILFSVSAFVASIIGFISFQIKSDNGEILDLRTMSPFISLIRLSLILIFGFGFSLWGIIILKSKYKWLLLITNIWIVYFILVSESLTGIVLLPVVFIYFLVYVLKRDLKLAISLIVVLLGLSTWIVIELKHISNLVFKNYELKIMDKTLNDRKYSHNSEVLFRENGHLVYDNFCEEEMEQEWNKRSFKKYDDTFKGFNFSSVIIRYLSSRGLSKDSVGISELSNLELEAIQDGVTNVYYINRNPLFKRIHVACMEVRDALELNRYVGRSIASRFVYLNTGYEIFKDNFWFGVGTGDVKDAFREKYQKANLFKEGHYKKTHNQFLTIALSLGIFGILVFSGIVILLIKNHTGSLSYLFILGQIIILLSMLWEDTLETQAGVSIFALLLNLFLFENDFDKETISVKIQQK